MTQDESRKAFLTAVDQIYGPTLRRFLARRLRNPADIADLMQEVYLRLLKMDAHETIRDPRAYLHTIASHVLHQRAQRDPRGTPDEASGVGVAEQTCEGDPAAEIEAEQMFAQIGAGLEKISPRVHATLILSRCYGLTLDEIARRFGVSRGQVKKYLARALTYVRARLVDTDEGSS